ncbi:sialic acid-binding Ig-like lectin 14 isoform X2 [Odocoileus virginianus]|uniref:Sialic acid-binding Ig-like lectin 14 isoform X2 n=1 Tax=Odocoileus virginianus TaxID=9874 RepID=A0ABM4GWN3_ODOVR
MVPLLLLLPLLWGGSLQELPGFELRVQESVKVEMCMDVRVSCYFSYLWYPWYPSMEPLIYWFREGDSLHSDPVATNDPSRREKPESRGRFRLVGDPSNNDCSLIIKGARLSDSGVYYLRMERGPEVKYTYRNKKLNLLVTAEKHDIQFVEPLEAGHPTKLTCKLSVACAGRQPLLFSWAGDALDKMDPETLHSSELTLTPRPQDHGSNLTCRVTLQEAQMTLETTMRLNVSYAPQLVITRISQESFTDLNGTSLPILEGQFLRLVCVADSNPPARLSWLWEGKPLSPSQRSDPGVLEIPRVGVGDGGEVTCRAQHPLGSQQVSFSLSVQKGPPSCSCETEEPQGSWPLVVTLIRGALMGAGFLLTYGLTWTYYTRCAGHSGAGLRGVAAPRSLS